MLGRDHNNTNNDDDDDDDLKKFDDVPLLDGHNDAGGDDDRKSFSSNNIMNSNDNSNIGFPSSSSTTNSSLLQLRIKSFKDVEVAVPNTSNVFHLKELIKHALGREQTEDRYMRLICRGKLLHPDTSPISEFKVRNDDVVHAVLAAKGVPPPTERVVTVVPAASSNNNSSINTSTSGTNSIQQQGRRRRGGTVVGPGGRVTRLVDRNNNNASNGLWNVGGSSSSNNDDDSFSSDYDDDNDIERGNGVGTASATAARRGFDRLRSAGLSRQEITAIRTYFNRNVDRYVEQHSQDHQDEQDLVARRRLFEEDWMSTQSPTSEFRLNLNQNTLLRFASLTNGSAGGGMNGVNWNAVHRSSSSVGTDRDFMWGFFLGFFVGFVMLVWVWLPTVPHKQKIGILTGISFSLAANVLNNADRDDLLD